MEEPALYAELGFCESRTYVSIFVGSEVRGEESADRDPVRGGYFGGL